MLSRATSSEPHSFLLNFKEKGQWSIEAVLIFLTSNQKWRITYLFTFPLTVNQVYVSNLTRKTIETLWSRNYDCYIYICYGLYHTHFQNKRNGEKEVGSKYWPFSATFTICVQMPGITIHFFRKYLLNVS